MANPVTYEVQCEPWPWDVKLLHVNHLKGWFEWPEATCALLEDPMQLPGSELPWRDQAPIQEASKIDPHPKQKAGLQVELDQQTCAFS